MTTSRPNNHTIQITYEPCNGDALYSPDGQFQLLLCEKCLKAEWCHTRVVSFLCSACANDYPVPIDEPFLVLDGEPDEEELQAVEEQGLDYFNQHIAGDR